MGVLLQSKDMPFRLIGDLKLPIGVKVSVNRSSHLCSSVNLKKENPPFCVFIIAVDCKQSNNLYGVHFNFKTNNLKSTDQHCTLCTRHAFNTFPPIYYNGEERGCYYVP